MEGREEAEEDKDDIQYPRDGRLGVVLSLDEMTNPAGEALLKGNSREGKEKEWYRLHTSPGTTNYGQYRHIS